MLKSASWQKISCSKLPNFIRVGCLVNQFDLSLPRKNSKKHVSSRVITKVHTYLALLSLSWRRLLSCRNQSIDLQRKWTDWFLYDRALRHERVKNRRRVAQCHWKIFTLLIKWLKLQWPAMWYNVVQCGMTTLVGSILTNIFEQNTPKYPWIIKVPLIKVPLDNLKLQWSTVNLK